MAEVMNSRTRIGAHINLSFFRPHSTPSKSVFWPPFPHRSSVCMSLFLMLLSCSPTFLLLLLLSCSSASGPASFHCWYFFSPPFSYLSDGGTVGQFFDTELWQPPSLLKEVLASSYLSFWLDFKAEKGYWWRYEPFQYANDVMGRMTLYQCIWALSYSFLSLPVQYVKL